MKLRPKSAAGFTLLEIILAVGIGVIFLGGAVVFLSTTGGDRELIQSRKMLEEEVGAAREKALETGMRQQILLNVRAVAGNEFPGAVEMDLITTEDMVAGHKTWAKPPETGFAWLVTGGGLVEPIRVRLRHGENRDEFEFNALTGESNTRRRSEP
jgi:type II secretory pathway pseudopilin PulG